MNTKQVADRLVQLCRQGEFEKVQKELYSNDAVSIEPHATPEFEKETKGLSAILKKGEKWNSMVDKMNKLEISEPIIADNSFACTMHLDVTMKGNQKVDMTEICVYRVKDGKIVSEEFVV